MEAPISSTKQSRNYAGLFATAESCSAEGSKRAHMVWKRIEMIHDYSLRNKKTRFESFVPVVEKAKHEKEHVTTLDSKSGAAGGSEMPWAQTPVTDLAAVDEGRGTILSLSDSVSGLTVVDPARKVLNKESAIWITAAKVEEVKGNTEMVGEIIERGIKTLKSEGGLGMDREFWIKEAEFAEEAGFVVTCKAIISNTIKIGVEAENWKRTWVSDAEDCKKRGSIETARAIYAHALTVLLTKKSIWLKAAQLEKSHGSTESLDEKWLASQDVPAARAILQDAYSAIPNSEEIWLAAFKLEFENNDPERSHMILAKARECCGTERVWMKSAIVERELGNQAEERRLLNLGLKLFNSFFKLWLMLGQLEERLGQLDQAKEAYESGLKHCPNCIPLWLSLSNLEERMYGLSKARAVLTMATEKNPKNPQLWLAVVRAESRAESRTWLGNESGSLMKKALQECPNSGILWAASIELAHRVQRISKMSEPWQKFRHDPHMIATVAKIFWHNRNVNRARTLLNRAVTLAPDIGDFWALLLKLEIQHGNDDNQKDVLRRCVAAEPKHGEKWQVVSKSVENSRRPTESILKKVVAVLGEEENSGEGNNKH